MLAIGRLKASKTVVQMVPSALVVLTGRLALSNPKLVRLPTGSTLATSLLARS
jgi:hypothetical protein